MPQTLRTLLVERAARLQGRPALRAPGLEPLDYLGLRRKVEGIALGLLALGPPPVVHAATGTPWDWLAEVAAAACGLPWDPAGTIPAEVLGGDAFNAEAGRGPYHAREARVLEDTPFAPGLGQGEVLGRLRALNRTLGWDHETRLTLPLGALGTPGVRAALWSALYAGAAVDLAPSAPFDPGPFSRFWVP